MKGSRQTPRLWEELRSHPDLLALDVEWQRSLGDDYDLARRFLKLTRKRSSSWPCGEDGRWGCARRIVEHTPGDIVAVCGDSEGRCPTVSITASERALYRLDWRSIAESVAGPLGIRVEEVALVGGADERGWQRGDFVRLGVAPFGRTLVACYLTRAGTSEELSSSLLRARRREGGDARVLFLLPVATGLAVAVRDTCAELGIDLLALEDVAGWTSGGKMDLDLSEYVYRHRLAVTDPSKWLWPRYPLILDPQRNRYWYRGRLLPFARGATFPRLFLECVARKAEAFVSRQEICTDLWPESYSDPDGPYTAWDRKVRGHKKTVDDLLKSVGGESIIDARSSGKDSEGGYRLLLNPGDIAWWSRREDRKIQLR